ncbi:MAG: hypothetical protein OEO21_12645, partial [Candidatus Krumholzibacteria bacterium]|nr:hypothetical protein [Candidatus Krumholzibacteria bacterium]
MKTTVATIGLAILLGTAALAVAGEKDKEAQEAYERVYDLIYSDDYTRAYEEASRFLETYPESRWVSAAAYWQCYSFQRTKRAYKEALECYEEYLEKYAESKWADDARAEALKLAKRLADAGDPYGKARLEALHAHGDETDIKLHILYSLKDDLTMAEIEEFYAGAKSAHVRKNLLYVVDDADVEDSEVAVFLVRVAKTDSDSEVRQQAVWSLVEYADHGDAGITAALLEIMRTE